MSNCTTTNFKFTVAYALSETTKRNEEEKSLRRRQDEKSLRTSCWWSIFDVAVKSKLLFIQLFRASDSKDYQRISEMQTTKLPCLIDLNADLWSSLMFIKTSLTEECLSLINNVCTKAFNAFTMD